MKCGLSCFLSTKILVILQLKKVRGLFSIYICILSPFRFLKVKVLSFICSSDARPPHPPLESGMELGSTCFKQAQSCDLKWKQEVGETAQSTYFLLLYYKLYLLNKYLLSSYRTKEQL